MNFREDGYAADDLESDESYEQEVDDMLDALMESEDISERRRRTNQRARARAAGRAGVPTATGQTAYRAPDSNAPVTQKQLKDALSRVGEDVKRNAAGIKTLNGQVGGLNTRIDGIVSVNTTQSKSIARLDKQMQIDGALNFAQGLRLQDGGDGLALVPDASLLIQGAIKTGLIGTSGALGNPALVGGIAFLLTQTNILGNVFGPRA
jgi:hypothetical protein